MQQIKDLKTSEFLSHFLNRPQRTVANDYSVQTVSQCGPNAAEYSQEIYQIPRSIARQSTMDKQFDANIFWFTFHMFDLAVIE